MEFLASLKLDPDNSKAHYELGKTHEQLGDQMAAIHHFQTALKIDPKLDVAQQNYKN